MPTTAPPTPLSGRIRDADRRCRRKYSALRRTPPSKRRRACRDRRADCASLAAPRPTSRAPLDHDTEQGARQSQLQQDRATDRVLSSQTFQPSTMRPTTMDAIASSKTSANIGGSNVAYSSCSLRARRCIDRIACTRERGGFLDDRRPGAVHEAREVPALGDLRSARCCTRAACVPSAPEPRRPKQIGRRSEQQFQLLGWCVLIP